MLNKHPNMVILYVLKYFLKPDNRIGSEALYSPANQMPIYLFIKKKKSENKVN